MSIKTDQATIAKDFKTSEVSVPVGFVKNNAAGDFIFGQSGSGWTFLETQIVPAGPAVQSLTFSGLNGDVDFEYRLMYDIVAAPNTDGQIRLEPNAVVTGAAAFTTTHRVSISTISITAQNNLMMCRYNPFASATDFHLFGECILWVRSGRQRQMWSWHTEINVAQGRSDQRVHHGRWNDEISNVTSLRIFGFGAAAANVMLPGTKISLYKIVRTL